MTYYAIKHIPTGNYLPQLRRRRGHTFTEPVPLSEAVPRLHKTAKNAKLALWFWIRGVWHEDNYAGDVGQWEYRGNVAQKKLDRKREDMQIVEMEVIEK